MDELLSKETSNIQFGLIPPWTNEDGVAVYLVSISVVLEEQYVRGVGGWLRLGTGFNDGLM